MCEYCGCRALTVIADLTAEHDRVVELIGRARTAHRSGDLSALAGIARNIRAVLGPHTAVEEQGLFPPLAAEFGGHVHALIAEHRHIETVLAEAAGGTPTDPAWPARLLATLHTLREHILAEQDGAFPAALSVLEPADWDAAAAVRARVGPSAPAPSTRAATDRGL